MLKIEVEGEIFYLSSPFVNMLYLLLDFTNGYTVYLILYWIFYIDLFKKVS